MMRGEGNRFLASSLSVSPSARKLIRGAGLHTAKDVLLAKPSQLARDLRLDAVKVVECLEEIKLSLGLHQDENITYENVFSRRTSSTGVGVKSVRDMLAEEATMNRHIVTHCLPLDRLFGGGIPIGELTEVCGAPGAGKTQLCTQIAVYCTMPAAFGGLEGEVVFIDSEGSFTIDRTRDIIESMLKHLKSIEQSSSRYDAEHAKIQRQALQQFKSVETVLSKIHYCRVHDVMEQIACVRSLPRFFESHPNIKLIVLDSVAFHFRHGFEDMSARTRLLNSHAQVLNSLASERNMAVLVSNQMTTKVGGTERDNGGARLAPALGESWSHAVANRLVLNRLDDTCDCSKLLPRKLKNDQRYVDAYKSMAIRTGNLVKSASRKQAEARYVILQQGIRMAPE